MLTVQKKMRVEVEGGCSVPRDTSEWRTGLPSKYRQIALRGFHDDMFHQLRGRTYWLVQQWFYWSNMYREVQEKVEHVTGKTF